MLARSCRAGRKIFDTADFPTASHHSECRAAAQQAAKPADSLAIQNLSSPSHRDGPLRKQGQRRHKVPHTARQLPQLAAHRTHSLECRPALAGQEGRFQMRRFPARCDFAAASAALPPRRAAGGKPEKGTTVSQSLLAVPKGRPPAQAGQSRNLRPRRHKAPHTADPPPPIAAKQLAADLAEAPLQPAARWDALCRVLARSCRAGRKILSSVVPATLCYGKRSTAAHRAPPHSRRQNRRTPAQFKTLPRRPERDGPRPDGRAAPPSAPAPP